MSVSILSSLLAFLFLPALVVIPNIGITLPNAAPPTANGSKWSALGTTISKKCRRAFP